MIQKSERQADILRLVETLDITPTMYKNAEEKYLALASFLEEHGIEAEIYPQGSFALGTVVRPSAKDPNAAYDLDFICKVPQTRDQISPSALRQKIEDVLKSDKRYADRLKKCGECFTIEYADIGEIGFSIDVVPATNESNKRKLELQRRSAHPELIETAIAIPRENGEKNYKWLTNNPRGFRTWFDEINRPFLEPVRDKQRQRVCSENGIKTVELKSDLIETDISQFNKKSLVDYIVSKGELASQELLKLAVSYRFAHEYYSGNKSGLGTSELSKTADDEEFRLIRELICCIVKEYNSLRKSLKMTYNEEELNTGIPHC